MTGTAVTQYQAPAPPSVQELDHLERMSKVLARSSIVPEYFRGKSDDIMIAGLGLRSNRLQLDVNTLGQCYVIKGKPGYMAQIQIALARRAGIDIEFDQDQVTAESATVRIKDRTGWHSVTVTMAQAKAAGFTTNATYQKIPDRMLLARAVTKAIDAYAPHVKLGIDIGDPADYQPDQIAPDPTGDETDAVEPGATASLPAPASAFAPEAAKRALLAFIATLTPEAKAGLRDALKAADVPRIDGPRFTVDHLASALTLIDEITKTETSVRGSADVAEVGGAGPDPQAGQPASTYANNDDLGREF